MSEITTQSERASPVRIKELCTLEDMLPSTKHQAL